MTPTAAQIRALSGCTLCGRRTVALGYWVPTESISRRLQAPPGKLRTVAYALCRKHARDPEKSHARVEAKILAHAAAMAGAPSLN